MKNHTPPLFFLRFFRWYCHPKMQDYIEGDLMEVYDQRLKKSGKRKADMKFIIDALLLFRPGIIKPIGGFKNLNNYGMLKSYFKIGWRNLTRHKMYSVINIGGFSIGIAACLLIALFIKDELSYDQYEAADRIYRVINVWNYGGKESKSVWFQAPFASALKEDYPEIEMTGRYNANVFFGEGGKQFRLAEKIENTYEDGFVFMDQGLLQILKLPMIHGHPAHCLDDPRTIVITQRKAEKYFPGENPVGRLVILDNDSKPYTIGGVIENFPANSHLQFDFLITLKEVEFWPGEQTDWDGNNYATYVKLKGGASAPNLEAKLKKVVTKYMLPLWVKNGATDIKGLANAASFKLQPLKEIHLLSGSIQDPSVLYGDIRFVWLFSAIAGFILLIACINFVNLSTAKSTNRAKEVGLRKTVGSHRGNIINQFLTESVLFSFLSFAVGLFLAYALLPYFNLLAAKSMVFPWKEWSLYPILLLAAILVGTLAGLYPAFYLSSFVPIQVLKGSIVNGRKNLFTRSSLVVFQFTASIVLIIATLVIYQQVNYILSKNVGFDKDQVLLIQDANVLRKNVSAFKNELTQLSSVKSASVSGYLPIKGAKRNSRSFSNEGGKTTGESLQAQAWKVDHDYIKTFGIRIVAGRDFSRDRLTDSSAIIINQTMAKQLGLKDPIGKRIETSRIWNIIGVAEDFNFESLRDNIGPLALTLGNEPSIISVKLNGSDVSNVLGLLTDTWRKFSLNQPIRYKFLDESFARMYTDVLHMGRIFTSFAALAIIVACLGLFALSSFMVEQRAREISIRLVLGSTMNRIVAMLAAGFLKLVFVSIVIAIPIGWFAMSKWLEDYAYRVELSWRVFALSGVIAIAIALVTVSFQSIKAAMTNPVKGLRSE